MPVRFQRWTNDRGNKVACWFLPTERYYFDFERCTPRRGWKQFDTDQDAWYFGVWVHIGRRLIFTYAEGDNTLVKCKDIESFRAELNHMEEFYGPAPPCAIGIDMETGQETHFYDDRPKV